MSDAPRLEACFFGNTDAARDKMYRRLAAVFEYSARKHCKGWEVACPELPAPRLSSAIGNPSHVWNTHKLEHWVKRAIEAPDGARVVLIDGDMLVRKPLDGLWNIDFQMAYTYRDGGTRLPFNGGVVALRVSDPVRAFLMKWREVNALFLGDASAHKNWRLKYAGINQASFGYMLERYRGLTNIAKLPCSEWNLCEWDRIDPSAARIIHIKSQLRMRLFVPPLRNAASLSQKRIIEWWTAEEKEMQHWQKRQAAKSASSDTATTTSTSAGV